MADGDGGSGVIRRLIDSERSVDTASADPDDPLVTGFAEFGLPPSSALAADTDLRDLEAWRHSLQIPANCAFVDGTLLMTVEALLGFSGPEALTPVTLWELTAFIDALLCFDQLYCIQNPVINVSRFNRRLGADVLRVIPDPDGGMLRRIAADAAARGLWEVENLRVQTGPEYAYRDEKQAVLDAWRAVLGQSLPDDAPFDMSG